MHGIDIDRVSRWLTDHVAEATAPFEFTLITGGRSNLTFLVTCADGRRLVLRRPPLGHVLATAHDMAHEHRIIEAVGRTDVPVPRTLGLCTDEAVNGAPFYVMEHVAGVVLDSPASAESVSLDVRRRASEHLVDVLAALHAADIDEISPATSHAGRATSSARSSDGRPSGPTPRPATCRRSTRSPLGSPPACRSSRAWRSPTATTGSAT